MNIRSQVQRNIGAFEARRKFGKLLREVEAERGQFIVERNGEPVAALVSMGVFNQWKKSRDEFFKRLEKMAQTANVSEDEAEKLAQEATEWARSQK